MLLGAIADDFTGGLEIAGMLALQGVRTMQMFGVPDEESLRAARDFEAVVVSLNTRSTPASEAVECSLAALDALRTLGARQIQLETTLVDAIPDEDLQAIPLITGGSEVSAALPAAWKAAGIWPGPQARPASAGPTANGRTLILAGSCSATTLRQVAEWRGPKEAVRLDALGEAEMHRLIQWCRLAWRSSPELLLYSPAAAAAGQTDTIFGEIAQRLLCAYDRLVVAGGDTSDAVLEALGVRAVEVGAMIDPGVPALRSVAGPTLGLALNSGDQGSPDFFRKAAGLIAP